jgi:hypothetical protein
MKGKAKVPNLSHEQIRNALDYNPASGVFTWKIRPAKNVKPGARAGGRNDARGYRCIRLDNIDITDSRLAWFYVTGRWPERRVRFKNGDPSDCRYENLTLFNGIGGEFDHTTREGKLAYHRAYRRASPRLEKARSLRASFGLSLEDYELMLAAQDGACAICKQPETHKRNGKVKALAVDHDHATGKVRGLLCFDCNTAIGKMKDSPEILTSAIRYLERHTELSSSTSDERNS